MLNTISQRKQPAESEKVSAVTCQILDYSDMFAVATSQAMPSNKPQTIICICIDYMLNEELAQALSCKTCGWDLLSFAGVTKVISC